MRLIAASVLSVFVVLPAFARLPVVDVSAGGVSARAAFGGVTTGKNNVSSVRDLYGSVNDATPAVTVAPAPKQVVARPAAIAPQKVATVETGEQIARADVLLPRRPSSDLWAHSTDSVPLRMPNPNEFAVIRSDAQLPEENLDTTANNKRPAIAQSRATVSPTVPVKPSAQPMAEIDAQLARLNELQHRADISIKPGSSNVSRPVETVADSVPTVVAQVNTPKSSERAVVGRVPGDASVQKSAPVKLSRLVVPMNDDVQSRTDLVKKNESVRITSVRDDMTKLSPAELRAAFRKTFLSENKHLSTYQIDDKFDVVSDMSSGIEGFTARRDLSESGGIRPLEIKIKFRNDDSALSRDNYNLLTEYAGVVLNNPMRAIQIAIPQSSTIKTDDRKLAARRLAIIEQVLRDSGISEQRVMPVLTPRSDDSFVLRIISSDQYETMTQQQKNLFGDTVNKKSYKSMSW